MTHAISRSLSHDGVDYDGAAPGRLPDGLVVYAVGDIHGRDDLLERILGQIAIDAADNAEDAERRLIITLGDYVDRGPHSMAVIDRLLLGPPDGFEMAHLMGNHERFMLDFLDKGQEGLLWLFNGGLDTMASYGVDLSPIAEGVIDVEALADALAEVVPADHLDWLKALKLHHQEGSYLFVHAGIRPGVALADQRQDDLLWIREPFLRETGDLGLVVVHGHTIVQRPQLRANRISLDTGAYATDRLTCAVFRGERMRYLTTD